MSNLEYLEKVKDSYFRQNIISNPKEFLKNRKVIALEIIAEELIAQNGHLSYLNLKMMRIEEILKGVKKKGVKKKCIT